MVSATQPVECPVHDSREKVHVLVIGAGFGGLGTAMQLKQAGIDDFVVLDRASEVGGTWQVNTYPGAQCDIPSILYSFSFAPNPNWTRLYPLQPEIHDYLRACAEDFGIVPHLRLNCEVRDATWDDAAQVWHVTTDQGAGKPEFSWGPWVPSVNPQSRTYPDSTASRARSSTPRRGITSTICPVTELPSSEPARRQCRSFRESSRSPDR